LDAMKRNLELSIKVSSQVLKLSAGAKLSHNTSPTDVLMKVVTAFAMVKLFLPRNIQNTNMKVETTKKEKNSTMA